MSDMSNEQLARQIQEASPETNGQELILQLYLQNSGILWRFAVKHARRLDDRQDLMQIGFFAVREAALSFRAERGRRFTTWLQYFMLKQLRDYYESTSSISISYTSQFRGRQDGSLPQVVSGDQELPGAEGITLSETIPAPDDTEDQALDRVMQQELSEAIREAVSALPDNQRRAISLYYFNGLSGAESAAAMSATERECRRRGLDKLSRNRNLRRYAQEIGCASFYHGSLGTFKRTGYSTVEAIAERDLTGLLPRSLSLSEAGESTAGGVESTPELFCAT